MDQLRVIEQSLSHYRWQLADCYDDDDTSWLEDTISDLETLAEELLNESH